MKQGQFLIHKYIFRQSEHQKFENFIQKLWDTQGNTANIQERDKAIKEETMVSSKTVTEDLILKIQSKLIHVFINRGFFALRYSKSFI